MHRYLNRPLPAGLAALTELALDLSWNWNQTGDGLWKMLDRELWERTKNPYLILQSVSQKRLEDAARDDALKKELKRLFEKRSQYMQEPGWFGRNFSSADLRGIAYFSMEFGLSEALPIYSGGLGVLAGDFLKTASDLGVPAIGIGLLYQQGYFRQVLAPDGRQLEAFPFNDPTSLPIVPVRDRDGGWLRIKMALPGRDLILRVWQAQVGKVPLYLLDSNDPLNGPWDRAITSTLYTTDRERRFLQEIALGIGGWLVVASLGLDVEVCHLNEGHAAMVVLARARSFMLRGQTTFEEALWATRPGNVFTTHTPVEVAFDRFDPDLFAHYAARVPEMLGISVEQLMSLGRRNPADDREPFNMAYLALRGSGFVNGVSELHGRVSRQIFGPLFPDWPWADVPITSVTNGAHQASWDSPAADRFWLKTCGVHRWREAIDELPCKIAASSDAAIWAFRAESRQKLVEYVRRRLCRQMREQCAAPDVLRRAEHLLDPNALTLGFARRFTSYKRPNLLLHDAERLARLLTNPDRPVQLVVAGKSHPADEEGKRLVQAMVQFTSRPDVFDRAVFLEDYEMALSQELVGGIDVWINTPRRLWEACGTSGMKVLSNGGLNLSELDGWWAEAYSPDVGWALGDGGDHSEPEWDALEARQLYSLLENQIVPEFYRRDETGLPREWIDRVRQSMARLTPRFSGNRMVREYVEKAYLNAARAFRTRAVDDGRVARELAAWSRELASNWKDVHFGEVRATAGDGVWNFDVQLYLADIDPDAVRVELYADPVGTTTAPVRIVMSRDGALPGAMNSHRYLADAPAARPLEHYTPRVVPAHQHALVPLEEPHIRWFRGSARSSS
ncbi:MAG: alpha-glucan family phosphorylase [Deltaproteobacteria bacterium]